MKNTRHFLCFALLLASGLEAAEVTATPKLSMSNLSGVPTPLEEYVLSIGDITVTRVINPLGQLKQGSPIMMARRLRLSKGTDHGGRGKDNCSGFHPELLRERKCHGRNGCWVQRLGRIAGSQWPRLWVGRNFQCRQRVNRRPCAIHFP